MNLANVFLFGQNLDYVSAASLFFSATVILYTLLKIVYYVGILELDLQALVI